MVSGELSMGQEDYYFNEVYRTIDETFGYLGNKWNIKIIKGLFDFALDEVMKNEKSSKLKEESKKNLRTCLNP